MGQGSSGHLLELVSFTYSQHHKGRGTQRSGREKNGREPGIDLYSAGVRRNGTAWPSDWHLGGKLEEAWLLTPGTLAQGTANFAINYGDILV